MSNISSSNLTTLYSGGNAPVPNGNLVIPGTLTVNGCAILTNCSSFSLLPTTADTILFGSAATSLQMGASTGLTVINNDLKIVGNSIQNSLGNSVIELNGGSISRVDFNYGIRAAYLDLQNGWGAIDATNYTSSTTTADQIIAFTFTTPNAYRSAKFQVQITSGTAYQALEIMVVHNGTTAFLNTYGDVRTGANLSTFNAAVVAGSVQLLATPVNAVTTYKTVITAISV